MRRFIAVIGMALICGSITSGCGFTINHKVTEPIRVEPIHITVDVNVRVQKELNNFFDEIDALD